MASKYNSILFLGDSIFQWPANFTIKFATDNPSVTVTTLAVSGGSYGLSGLAAGSGLESFLSAFQNASLSPVDAVVIGTGINAVHPHSYGTLTSAIPASETINEVIDLVGAIKDTMPFADIYFMKPFPVGAALQASFPFLNDSFENLAEVTEYQEVNFPILDFQAELGMDGATSSNPRYDQNTSLYEADLLHPNAAGHIVLADTLTEYFTVAAKTNPDEQIHLDEYKVYWATGSTPTGRDFGTRRINTNGDIQGNYICTNYPTYD